MKLIESPSTCGCKVLKIRLAGCVILAIGGGLLIIAVPSLFLYSVLAAGIIPVSGAFIFLGIILYCISRTMDLYVHVDDYGKRRLCMAKGIQFPERRVSRKNEYIMDLPKTSKYPVQERVKCRLSLDESALQEGELAYSSPRKPSKVSTLSENVSLGKSRSDEPKSGGQVNTRHSAVNEKTSDRVT